MPPLTGGEARGPTLRHYASAWLRGDDGKLEIGKRHGPAKEVALEDVAAGRDDQEEIEPALGHKHAPDQPDHRWENSAAAITGCPSRKKITVQNRAKAAMVSETA